MKYRPARTLWTLLFALWTLLFELCSLPIASGLPPSERLSTDYCPLITGNCYTPPESINCSLASWSQLAIGYLEYVQFRDRWFGHIDCTWNVRGRAGGCDLLGGRVLYIEHILRRHCRLKLCGVSLALKRSLKCGKQLRDRIDRLVFVRYPLGLTQNLRLER